MTNVLLLVGELAMRDADCLVVWLDWRLFGGLSFQRGRISGRGGWTHNAAQAGRNDRGCESWGCGRQKVSSGATFTFFGPSTRFSSRQENQYHANTTYLTYLSLPRSHTESARWSENSSITSRSSCASMIS